ncbi:MAG TPA: hypothetical protein VGU90_06035 [Terriglobales bacterium]|nr:hypothetical protein [Terriglobales bacterium]
MKAFRAFAGVLGAIAILMASTALAADKGSMKLFDQTTVNGTQLSPGDYEVQWEGTGSDVHLNILRGKKVVASTPATVVQLKSPAPQNITSTRGGSNDKTLTGISFRGKNYALAISNEPSPKTDTDVAKK